MPLGLYCLFIVKLVCSPSISSAIQNVTVRKRNFLPYVENRLGLAALPESQSLLRSLEPFQSSGVLSELWRPVKPIEDPSEPYQTARSPVNLSGPQPNPAHYSHSSRAVPETLRPPYRSHGDETPHPPLSPLRRRHWLGSLRPRLPPPAIGCAATAELGGWPRGGARAGAVLLLFREIGRAHV